MLSKHSHWHVLLGIFEEVGYFANAKKGNVFTLTLTVISSECPESIDIYSGCVTSSVGSEWTQIVSSYEEVHFTLLQSCPIHKIQGETEDTLQQITIDLQDIASPHYIRVLVYGSSHKNSHRQCSIQHAILTRVEPSDNIAKPILLVRPRIPLPRIHFGGEKLDKWREVMQLMIWKAVKQTQRSYQTLLAADKFSEMYYLCDQLERYAALLRSKSNQFNAKPSPQEWLQNAAIDQQIIDIRNQIQSINARQKQLLMYSSNEAFVSYLFDTSVREVETDWLFGSNMLASDILRVSYLRLMPATKHVFCHTASLQVSSVADIHWEDTKVNKLTSKSSSRLNLLSGDGTAQKLSSVTSFVGDDNIALPLDVTLPRSLYEALWNVTTTSKDSLYYMEEYTSIPFTAYTNSREKEILKFRQHHFRFYWSVIAYLHAPSNILALFSELNVASPSSDNLPNAPREVPAPLPVNYADDEEFDIDAIVESTISHFIQTDTFGPEPDSARSKEKRRNASPTIDMNTLGTKETFVSASAKMAKLDKMRSGDETKVATSENKDEKHAVAADLGASTTEKKSDAMNTENSTDSSKRSTQASPRRMASAEIDVSHIGQLAENKDTVAQDEGAVTGEAPNKLLEENRAKSQKAKTSPRRMASAEIDLAKVSMLTNVEDAPVEKTEEAIENQKKSPRRMASADIGDHVDKLERGNDTAAIKEDTCDTLSMTPAEEKSASDIQSSDSMQTQHHSKDKTPTSDESKMQSTSTEPKEERAQSNEIADSGVVLSTVQETPVKEISEPSEGAVNDAVKPKIVHNTLKSILDVMADLPLLKHINKVWDKSCMLLVRTHNVWLVPSTVWRLQDITYSTLVFCLCNALPAIVIGRWLILSSNIKVEEEFVNESYHLVQIVIQTLTDMDHIGVSLMSALLHEWIRSLLHILEKKSVKPPASSMESTLAVQCFMYQLDAYFFAFLCMIRKHQFQEHTYASMNVVKSLANDVLRVVDLFDDIQNIESYAKEAMLLCSRQMKNKLSSVQKRLHAKRVEAVHRAIQEEKDREANECLLMSREDLMDFFKQARLKELEEKRLREEAEAQRIIEEEKRMERMRDEQRIALEKRKAEIAAKRRAEALRKQKEKEEQEAAIAAAEALKKKQAEEAALAEERRKAAEEKRRQEEEKRAAEKKRLVEEAMQRAREEAARQQREAEEKRRAEEEALRRELEEKRRRDEEEFERKKREKDDFPNIDQPASENAVGSDAGIDEGEEKEDAENDEADDGSISSAPRRKSSAPTSDRDEKSVASQDSKNKRRIIDDDDSDGGGGLIDGEPAKPKPKPPPPAPLVSEPSETFEYKEAKKRLEALKSSETPEKSDNRKKKKKKGDSDAAKKAGCLIL